MGGVGSGGGEGLGGRFQDDRVRVMIIRRWAHGGHFVFIFSGSTAPGPRLGAVGARTITG